MDPSVERPAVFLCKIADSGIVAMIASAYMPRVGDSSEERRFG